MGKYGTSWYPAVVPALLSTPVHGILNSMHHKCSISIAANCPKSVQNIFANFYQSYNQKAWPLEDQSRRKRLTVIDQGQSHLRLLDRLEMVSSSTS